MKKQEAENSAAHAFQFRLDFSISR